MTWCKLLYNPRELQLLGTLNGGQSFRWAHNKDTDEWTGIFSKTVWILRQDDNCLLYKVVGSLLNSSSKIGKKRKNGVCSDNNEDLFKRLLEQYFRLDVNLGEHYKEWSERDELFKSAGVQFYGIRMLKQEPVENLFSFICSQNNNISRISGMVEKLCTNYGEEICQYDGVTYYAFPEVNKLVDPKVESELRVLGFGYRAKFIQKAASQIVDSGVHRVYGLELKCQGRQSFCAFMECTPLIVEAGGEDWFCSLQDMKYMDAKKKLMTLHGIGPKVADCICLMSLSHLSAVPVDTHVYQIAAQHYLPHLRGRKSVTDTMYRQIGDHFRTLYGDLAGWAHTVLFCADLKKFQNGESETTEKKETVTEKSKKKRKC